MEVKMNAEPVGIVNPEKKVDPAHRIWIPIEKKDVQGTWVFSTVDGDKYLRDPITGVIRRKHPKVNGKQAKRARQRGRNVSKNRRSG